MKVFNTLPILFSTLLMSVSCLGQDLYDIRQIQNIEITFDESNWDQILDNAYNSGEYIMAKQVAINGEVYDSVGVKYKGNSTYRANQVKNPWHIELDTYKDQDYQGYTDIKLSNVAKDPSFLREVLSYQILRNYMDAPESNYANVSVNGQLIGLYSNSEAVSKKFVKSRFGSKSNTFVKCNPIGGAGPQASDFPDLQYLGQDSTQYYPGYELKSDDGWQDLIDFCDTLNNTSDAVEAVLDVDRALWMLAFNNALVNLDSYSGGFKQNYYLYQDDFGRFLSVVWDLNESFGRFSMSGSSSLNSTTSKQQMDVFLHEGDSRWPLISKLLANPSYKKMYVAHLKTMIQEQIESGDYYDTALELRELIDDAVSADPNKFFTYNNFDANLDSDVSGGGGPGGGSTPGIATLMNGRANYILGLSQFSATAPEIVSIALPAETPVVGETIIMTATINDADEAYFYYRYDTQSPFVKLEMSNDGNGIFTVEIDIADSKTEYYIYAENSQAGKFSPQRAQHDFFTLLATNNSFSLGDLVINEVLASNDTFGSDADGEFDDWVELYNNGNETIDLSEYSLSDDNEELNKWSFPDGVSIAAGDYLIVWADNDVDQEGLHANFKLSAGGETLTLSDNAGLVLDEIVFDDQEKDVSYGRIPNGTGSFRTMLPTFNAQNSDATSVKHHYSQNLKLFPNPTSRFVNLVSNEESLQGSMVTLYDLKGNILDKFIFDGVSTIDLSERSSGVYVLHIGNQMLKVLKL